MRNAIGGWCTSFLLPRFSSVVPLTVGGSLRHRTLSFFHCRSVPCLSQSPVHSWTSVNSDVIRQPLDLYQILESPASHPFHPIPAAPAVAHFPTTSPFCIRLTPSPTYSLGCSTHYSVKGVSNRRRHWVLILVVLKGIYWSPTVPMKLIWYSRLKLSD